MQLRATDHSLGSAEAVSFTGENKWKIIESTEVCIKGVNKLQEPKESYKEEHHKVQHRTNYQ